MSRSRGMGDDTERFGRDVDRLLAGQPLAEGPDDAYQADLELARLLGRAQFVPDLRFKSRLRSHLLHQLYENEEGKEIRIMSPIRVFRSLVRPLLVAGVSAVIVLGVVFAVSPDVRAAAQQLWVSFVEVDSPWALLPAAQKHPAAPPEVTAEGGDVASAGRAGVPSAEAQPSTGKPEPPASQPESSAAEGLPVPDVQPTRALLSLEEAQAKVDFEIQMPAALPEGYSFLGAMPMPEPPAGVPDVGVEPPADLPKTRPPQAVTLLFSHADGGTLTLSEMRVSGRAPAGVPLPAGGASVQDVTVNGQPAQYVEGRWTEDGWVSGGHYQLHWQDAEGLMFDLVSNELALEALLAVAESLE